MSGPTTSPAAQLGAIEVTGADAGDFLRAQLTNDVLRLGPDRHFIAAWCDPKGRTLAVMRVVERGERYILILPRTLIPGIIDRLRMYVLRARVNLADISSTCQFAGVTSGLLPTVNRTEVSGDLLLLGLPADCDDRSRALVMAPGGTELPPGALPIDSDTWQLSDVDAGVPAIYPETQNLFVPQMLNLHWLMAIDFDKGCFPGQEVVARLHYRGRLTRRLYRLDWSGARPEVGAEITDDSGKRQGTVIRVSATAEDAGRLLAVVNVNAAAQASLAMPGTALSMLNLPYATPD